MHAMVGAILRKGIAKSVDVECYSGFLLGCKIILMIRMLSVAVLVVAEGIEGRRLAIERTRANARKDSSEGRAVDVER
jgi:hypothetical protein